MKKFTTAKLNLKMCASSSNSGDSLEEANQQSQLWRCTQERLSVTALWPIFHRERKSHKKSRAQFSERLELLRHVTVCAPCDTLLFHNFSFYSAIKASHQAKRALRHFRQVKALSSSLKAGFDFRLKPKSIGEWNLIIQSPQKCWSLSNYLKAIAKPSSCII